MSRGCLLITPRSRTDHSNILPILAGALVLALVMLPSEPWGRSFGGDYWLHLSLLDLQADSWLTYNLPALLVSFEPLGGLSPVALSSGGGVYMGLGILGALGVPIPILAPLGILGASLVAFLSIFYVARKQASPWVATVIMTPQSVSHA